MKLINKIKSKGITTTILFLITSPLYILLSKIMKFFTKYIKVNEKYILFVSSPDFSDNSKVLYNYYRKLKEYEDYKFIWLISRNSNHKKYKEKNTKFIKENSFYHRGKNLKAIYYISKCKLIFFTHSSPFESMKKKKEQIIINLWHGCGYKNTQNKGKPYIERYPFDYALVPGKIFVETKSKMWGCSKDRVVDIGYPRYNLFYMQDNNAEKIINEMKKNNKLVMWMPTFRKTGNNYYPEESIKEEYELPLLKSDQDLTNLNKICKKYQITLLIKRHPMQVEYQCEKLKLSNIFFISNTFFEDNKIELYSLLRYTNGLITDYSSIAIDYLLLDKPIGFTLDDFESYEKTRGFAFENPKKYMPGQHIYNYDDMKSYIIDIGNNQDKYKKNRKEIIDEVHNKCNDYCQRIIEFISKITKEV